MADGSPGDDGVKLGALLKLGRETALEADPMADYTSAFRTTYLVKRPMYCGAQYRTQMGDKVVCTRSVEFLPSGLPTGRCGQCRDREMSFREMRRSEARRLDLAEKNAKRFDGAKHRTGFTPDGER